MSTTVSRYSTKHGRIEYAYENRLGAMVATRTLVAGQGWTVRLYAGPDDWEMWGGLPEFRAERMCLQHVEAMS